MKEFKLLTGYIFKSIRYKDYYIFFRQYPNNEIFISITHYSDDYVSDHLRFKMDRPFEFYCKRLRRLVIGLDEYHPPNICISRALYFLCKENNFTF
jgi:hypothetical protein